MAIINISNGKNQGKISRIHGSRNYVVSAPNVRRYDNERYYYTNIIQTAKNYIGSKNYKKYINTTHQYGNRLSDKTLNKILRAYQDTLRIGKKLSKKTSIEMITNNLERNLKKYKISPSTIQKILKYDPQFNQEIIKKDSTSKRKRTSKKISKNNSQTDSINTAYIAKIINFSFQDFDEKELNHFIKTINTERKILSESLIRNIILAYRETLKENIGNKELINNNLQRNLLRKGVHSDLIKLILDIEPNYNKK
ncbi:hypothetical protein ACW66K_05115 [Aerococcus urinaeequi]